MTKRLAVALAAVLLATLAGAQDKPAAAAEGKAAAGSDRAAAAKEGAGPMEMQPAGKGQAASRRTMKLRAKVVAVDVANREITLKGQKGRTETFKVSPAVKRLAEIQPGDEVVMKYEQGLVLRAQKAGEAAEPTGYAEAQRAPLDQPPGGAATAQVSGTVTVVAVDQKSRIVVLEGPQGNLHKVKAGPDIKLGNVKPGAKLDATYTESLAVSIEKASAKKAPKQ